MADTNPLQGISVTPPDTELPAQPGPISIFDRQDAPLIFDQDTAKDRATKHDFGLGEYSPGIPQLTHDILYQKEDGRRAYLAAIQDQRDLQSRTKLLGEIAAVRNPGQPISKEEIDLVNSLRPEHYQEYRNDPQTFYEKGFAKQVVEAVMQSGYRKTYDQAIQDYNTPETIQQMVDRTGDLITRQQSFMRLLKDTETRYKNTGTFDKVVSFAEGLVPILDAQRLGQVLGTKSVTQGSVLEEATDRFWSMPIGDAIPQAKAAIDALAEKDIGIAVSFARALVSYSATQKFLDNAMSVADASIVGGALTKGAFKGLQFSSALKDIVKATSSRKFNVGDILADTGNLQGSGVVKAQELLEQRANRVGKPESLYDLRMEIPSEANPNSVINGYSGSLGNERARRIADMRTSNAEAFTKIFKAVSVDRLPQGSTAKSIAEKMTDELFNRQSSQAGDAILDIRTINQSENIQRGLYRAYQIGERKFPEAYPSVVDNVALKRGLDANAPISISPRTMVSANDDIAIQMGRKDATLFESPEAAHRAAVDDYGLSGYHVLQKGNGFYIEYHKAVREDLASVTQALKLDTNLKTPNGMLTYFAGLLGAGNQRVSKVIAGDMVVSTYGSTGLHKLIENMAQPIQTLKILSRKKTYNDFIEFVSRQRDMPHPVTKDRGYFSETLADFESKWFDQHNYMPSEKIARAYFSYTDLVNKDWMLRNLHITSNKVRLGLEDHAFHISKVGDDGASVIVKDTPAIEGRTVQDIPWGEKSANSGIFVHDLDPNNFQYHKKLTTKKDWPQKKKEEYIKDLVDNKGYKIIQLSDIGEETFRKLPSYLDASGKSILPKGKINYVLARDTSSAPLGFKQIPYKPGGHVEYPNGWFVAQPNVRWYGGTEEEPRTATYYGDNHMHFRTTEGEARKLTKAYDNARLLLRDGSAGLDDFVRRNLPYTPDEWRGLFKGEDAWDINQPFYTKASNTNLATQEQLVNKYKAGVFQRASDSVDNIYGSSIDLRFAGERNQTLRADVNSGTAEVPHWNYKTADLIDPITTQLRATSQLLRDTYLGDLKWKSANSFVSEFGHLLDIPKGGDALRNPIRYLLDPPWRADVQGSTMQELNAAQNFRRATMNLMGLHSDFDKQVFAWQQRVANWNYEHLPTSVSATIEPWLLHRSGDITRFVKAISAGMQVSVLVPHQLLLQAATMANMVFANPLKIPMYMAQGTLMRMAMFTEKPDMIKALGKMSEAFGGNADHFVESYNALTRTGFHKVGGEHVYRDDYFHPPLIQGAGGYAYSWLHGFFTEGERWNRHAAWATSYDGWRSVNPLAKLDDNAITQILRRADQYAGNMSTAGKAVWQQGWKGVPAQYAAYSAKIAEMFLGKEFTPAQRIRAFAGYSTIFGYGTASGSAMGIWPTGKTIDAYLRDNNIDTDANTFHKVFHDGLASLMAEWAVGDKFSIGDRLGGGGLNTLRDVARGKKTFLEAAGGPSGLFGMLQEKPSQSLLFNMLTSFGNFLGVPMTMIRNTITGEREDPHTWEAINDLLSNSTGYNSMKRTYLMATLGKYVAKNEKVLESDITGKQAFLSLITGSMPSSVQQMYEMGSDMSLEKDMKGNMWNKAAIWFRRALKAENQKDFDSFWKKGDLFMEASGMNPQERESRMKQLSKEYGEGEVVQSLIKWGSSNTNYPGRFEYAESELKKIRDRKEGR